MVHKLPHLGELSISIRTGRNINTSIGESTYDLTRRLPVPGRVDSDEIDKFTKLITQSRLNNSILTSPYQNKTQSLKRFIHIKKKSISLPKASVDDFERPKLSLGGESPSLPSSPFRRKPVKIGSKSGSVSKILPYIGHGRVIDEAKVS